jgi:1-acyl-sn-glycerol-3-phosphate acyltransferase
VSTEPRPASKLPKRKSEKTAAFRFFGYLLLPFMHSVGKYRLLGTENVPMTGAFVLAPNHYSNIDPIVIGLAMWKLGRMPHYLAKASMFRIPVFGWIFRKAGQIPVERASARAAGDPVTAAKHVAENGLAVVIYPEGTLTRDPDLWPMRGKFGAVRTALEANLPLIPAASWGAQKILPRYSSRISLFPRKDVDILFGPPVDLSEFAGKPLDLATLTAATEKVMTAITGLLEQLRGEKAPTERWDPAVHGQTEFGRLD